LPPSCGMRSHFVPVFGYKHTKGVLLTESLPEIARYSHIIERLDEKMKQEILSIASGIMIFMLQIIILHAQAKKSILMSGALRTASAIK